MFKKFLPFLGTDGQLLWHMSPLLVLSQWNPVNTVTNSSKKNSYYFPLAYAKIRIGSFDTV
jgi:hypothetical protein